MTSAGKAIPVATGLGRSQPAGGISGRRPTGLAVFLIVGTVASLLFVLPLAWAVFRPCCPAAWWSAPRHARTSGT
jgi:hypothetical protein